MDVKPIVKCCEEGMKKIEKGKSLIMAKGVDATPGNVREIVEIIEEFDKTYLSLYEVMLKVSTLGDDSKVWM